LEHSILAHGYHSAIHRAGIKKGHALNSCVEMLNRISGSSTFYIRLRSTCLAEVEQLVAAGKQFTADDEITCAASTDQWFNPIE